MAPNPSNTGNLEQFALNGSTRTDPESMKVVQWCQ